MINEKLVKQLQDLLQKDGVGALLVAPGNDMKFLLGGTSLLCERFQALVVPAQGAPFYICNALHTDEVTSMVPGIAVYAWSDSDDFAPVAAAALTEHGLAGKKIAVNSTVRAFNLVRLMEALPFTPVNGKDYLELTRIIKTEAELENLRKSAWVADKTFEELVKFIRPGVTERDIKNEIVRLCKAYGGDTEGGDLVAVGANAAAPHYTGDDAVVTERTSVLVDYGCTVGGMHSDITRTVFVGKATEREKYLYDLVLQANLAGEAAAVDGAWIPDVDMAARQVIADAGLGQYFNHRLGHGIGYANHEAPYIHGNYPMHLAPGMAFSCEPGIYIKDEIGIRIEDVVIINEKGQREVLNKCTKKLIEII